MGAVSTTFHRGDDVIYRKSGEMRYLVHGFSFLVGAAVTHLVTLSVLVPSGFCIAFSRICLAPSSIILAVPLTLMFPFLLSSFFKIR